MDIYRSVRVRMVPFELRAQVDGLTRQEPISVKFLLYEMQVFTSWSMDCFERILIRSVIFESVY